MMKHTYNIYKVVSTDIIDIYIYINRCLYKCMIQI